jgi:hypothetical protein
MRPSSYHNRTTRQFVRELRRRHENHGDQFAGDVASHLEKLSGAAALLALLPENARNELMVQLQAYLTRVSRAGMGVDVLFRDNTHAVLRIVQQVIQRNLDAAPDGAARESCTSPATASSAG